MNVIRELITMFWGWRRQVAEDAGRKVLDPEGPMFLFLSWIFCPKAKGKAKRKGVIPRGGNRRGPVRERGGKWVCTGCGQVGYAPDEETAYGQGFGHAQLHGNQYDVAVEPV